MRIKHATVRENINRDYTDLHETGYLRVAQYFKAVFSPYAWPGTYTIIFMLDDNSVLCADCAKRAFLTDHETITCDTYDEGPTMYCDDCNTEIESSYGDPE